MQETLTITYHGIKNLVIGLLPLLLASIPILIIAWRIGLHLVLLRSSKPGASRAAVSDTIAYAIFAVIIIVLLGILLSALPHPHDMPRRFLCAKNLKDIFKSMEAYATDHQGFLPPIDDLKNNFIMSGDSLFPEYVDEARRFACPSDPEYWPLKNFRLLSIENHAGSTIGDAHADCITDMSYCYFGWIITNQTEAQAFFEVYDRMMPADYDKDITVPDGTGNGGGNVIYRLRADLSQLPEGLDLDPSRIPVLWDKPSMYIPNFSEVPAGCNVLYLDGHVDFIRVEAPWVEGEDTNLTPFPVSRTLSKLLDERSHGAIPDCYDFESDYETEYEKEFGKSMN